MSIQVKRRREAASFLATFTGAQAELIVDTTNNRVQVHDGVTAGGWPAAKLSEVVTNTRTAVSDAAYGVLASDRLIAFTALTASRAVTLCAASAYPTGTCLRILDESGACSASNTIIVNRAGSDTIDGGLNFVLDGAYGALALESNGLNAWTVLSPTPNLAVSRLGIGTAADPSNPLSVSANTALFNALPTGSGGSGDIRQIVNKDSAANTASFLFQDGFSGRSEIGLCGDDNFHFKVSPNGSAWSTGLLIDATTGALTPGNARTAVSDAAYSALATDRLIAYTALTAARVVSLPAASAFPCGVPLIVLDQSGSCSATQTITIDRAGSDVINSSSSPAAASVLIDMPYGYAVLISNGSTGWNVGGGSPQAPLTIRSETNPEAAGLGSIVIAGNVNKERQEIQSSVQPQFQGYLCGTSVDAPTAVPLGGILFGLAGGGYNGVARPSPFASSIIMMKATEAWTPTANGSAITFGTTPNGTASAGNAYERMRIDNSGNVGIGTTSPQQPLDVIGTIQTRAPNGSTMQLCVAETLVTLSGASTDAPIGIPANCIVFSVAALVVEAVTGAPSYGVGVSGNPTQFGGSLGVALGSSNFGLIGPEPFYAATPLVVTATSGGFTGGQIRLAIHYMTLGGPTS